MTTRPVKTKFRPIRNIAVGIYMRCTAGMTFLFKAAETQVATAGHETIPNNP